MQGDGTAPLNVYFRIPPDIYYPTEGPNTRLHLVYRYNSIPIGPISSMQVRVNNAFLGSIPLIPGQETSRRMQTDVPVPVVNLRPFSNTFSFDFTFQLLKEAGCKNTTPINMQGAILGDSYLDLRGYPHWAPMPNLEIFANAGFPFTRVADLSETTVVLPPTPTEQEIETFVTLMGHFGRQTGFPACASPWPAPMRSMKAPTPTSSSSARATINPPSTRSARIFPSPSAAARSRCAIRRASSLTCCITPGGSSKAMSTPSPAR